MPLIDELHGAVERQNMGAQMEDLAAETTRLSESGVIGDEANMDVKPHTGLLGWSMLHGGTWYSATLQQNSEFRIEGALNLDDEIRIRYPQNEVEVMCMTDLRASAEALSHYRIPLANLTLTATSYASIESGLGPYDLSFEQGIETSYQIPNGGVWMQSGISNTAGEAWIHSERAVRVIAWRGDGGAMLLTPDTPSIDEYGRAWTVPLIAEQHTVHLIAEQSFDVSWEISTAKGSGTSSQHSVSSYPPSASSSIHSWTGSISTATPERFALTTSSPARMIIATGSAANLDGSGAGSIAWPDQQGSWSGKNYLPPAMDGSLLIENLQANTVTVRISGLYQSISALDSLRIGWDGDSSSWIEANGPIRVHWLTDSTTVGGSSAAADGWRPGSMDVIPASDTGRTSGGDWNIEVPTNGGDATNPTTGEVSLLLQPASFLSGWTIAGGIADSNQLSGTFAQTVDGVSIQLATTVTGSFGFSKSTGAGPLRAWVVSGDDGQVEVMEGGADRCVIINLHASGWMDALLPWQDVSYLRGHDVRSAWIDGTHPFGFSMHIRGEVGDDPQAILGVAWALHLPRLAYVFDSSVSNLEIATRGGFVGTNHPEYQPNIIISPPTREGPGPRLAATIPVLMPTRDSVSGGGAMEISLTLENRVQLVSTKSWQVRMGWDGPYGAAVASEASRELTFSADWLTFPGQLDLLDDYVGWVQLNPSMSEIVYHAGGGEVMFNLQYSSISSKTTIGDS